MIKRELKITPEILAVIAEIDEFKGKWSALSSLTPERLSQMKRVATIESVGSSTRIEGASLNDAEVEALLANLNIDSFKSRDEEEVAGYADLMDTIFENYHQIHLTENYIKQLHSILMRYSKKDSRHRGDYKKLQNHVEAFDAEGKSLGIIFKTATPFETPTKMKELVSWYTAEVERKVYHPLMLIGMFIVIFLAIHPFQDGNGRLSRALTTFLLLKFGYSYVPFSSMETIVESNKDAYYRALRRTQKNLNTEDENFEPWLLFFLKTMQKQKNHLEAKITQEERLTEIATPKLSLDILSLLWSRKRVSLSEVDALIDANRNTIKSHLKKLVLDGRILRHGRGRGTWYTANEYKK